MFKLFINKKRYKFTAKTNIPHRIKNILFSLALFNYNQLDTNVILKNMNKLKPVDGRGLIFNKKFNNLSIKFIDETYNANPDTMRQSIEYFNYIISKGYDKILILGDMNELGNYKVKYHLEILKFVEKFKFHYVILCGKFFQTAISKIKKPLNKYIVKRSADDIIKYIKFNLHKKATIMAKCSNNTIVNKFGMKFIKMKGSN